MYSSFNLTGKSTLLSVIGHKEIPIPNHFDIYHLKSEIEASEKTALQCVMEVNEERLRLEKEAEELAHYGDDGPEHERYFLLSGKFRYISKLSFFSNLNFI